MTNSEATRRGFFRPIAAAVLLTSITTAHVQAQKPGNSEKVRPVPQLQGKYVRLNTVCNTSDTRANVTPHTEIAWPKQNQKEGDNGWYYIGMLAKSAEGEPDEDVALVVRKHPNWGGRDPLAPAKSTTRIWGLSDHGGWGIYRAESPDGYYAVGDFFVQADGGLDPNWLVSYRTVHIDCLKPLAIQAKNCLWLDAGSGAREDGSIWPIPVVNLHGLPYSRHYFDSTHDNEWQIFKGGVGDSAPSGVMMTLNPDMIEILPQDTATPAATKLSLLTTYAPLLRLSPDERYMPTSTDFLLANMNAFRNETGKIQLVTKTPLSEPSDDSLPFFRGDLASAKVYAYWTDNAAGVNLNYFFFYGYNRGKPVAGTIFDNHVGDIEHLTVRLEKRSDTWQPTAVGYSYHEGETVVEWKNVPKVDGTHPVAYSAEGSHGCWPTAGENVYKTINIPLPFDLSDTCRDGGEQWDTWNHLVALDYSDYSKTGSNLQTGGPLPTWMVAGPQEVDRWGNPAMVTDNIADQGLFGMPRRCEDGPGGPQFKGCWGTQLD